MLGGGGGGGGGRDDTVALGRTVVHYWRSLIYRAVAAAVAVFQRTHIYNFL